MSRNSHFSANTMSNICFSLSLMTLIVSALLPFGCPDAAKDREECQELLVGLATCLPYVGGNAKSPTPDCCTGLKQVLATDKKCLCVVVRDRNDPELGLSINVTLALGLPSVCHAPANVSQCPALLHLAPNSSDAQVFYQFGHGAPSTTASSPIQSVHVNSTGGQSSAAAVSGDCRGRRSLWLELGAGGGIFLWCLTWYLVV